MVVLLVLYLFIDKVVRVAVNNKEQREFEQTSYIDTKKGSAMFYGNVAGMSCPVCGRKNRIVVNHHDSSIFAYKDKHKEKMFVFNGLHFYAKCYSCKNIIDFEKVFRFLNDMYFQVTVYVVWWKKSKTFNAADEYVDTVIYPSEKVCNRVVKGLKAAFDASAEKFEVPDYNLLESSKRYLKCIETEIRANKRLRIFISFEDNHVSRARTKK